MRRLDACELMAQPRQELRFHSLNAFCLFASLRSAHGQKIFPLLPTDRELIDFALVYARSSRHRRQGLARLEVRARTPLQIN